MLGRAQTRRVPWTIAIVYLAGCSSSSPGSSGRSDAGGGSPAVHADSGALDGRVRDEGPVVTSIALPDGAPGVGFDDIWYSTKLKKVLVPAGRSGNLDLVDPVTLGVTAIGGFSTAATFTLGSHADGTTSADAGGGVLVALDQNTTEFRVIDPSSLSLIGTVKTASGPDYVRWVEPTSEFWVTEPGAGQVEIFTVKAGGMPESVAKIAVAGGPEAIAVDIQRGRVYTNSFLGQTYAIDVAQRQIVETWPNGCSVSLGLALDETRGFLFVACAAGSVVVLDVKSGGAKLGEIAQGSGLDIVSYSPLLHHLYVPGGTSGDLGILAISSAGEPTLLGTVPTAPGARGVAADDRGNAWVCDPAAGGLLEVKDRFAKTD
jgi:hypothetical protein